jgi:hypothetical protein
MDGGLPDRQRDLEHPPPCLRGEYVATRIVIAAMVVIGAVVLPILVLAGSVSSPEAIGAVLAPLVILTRAVARFFF